ncbi:hypothetical protein RJT34_11027 [Clitoria ternatea]|uniref:Uncharacterized protein n=1 Tax=Clitoria ternatea TaxID=43366 RepID=A0AAN9JJ63_CLITE
MIHKVITTISHLSQSQVATCKDKQHLTVIMYKYTLREETGSKDETFFDSRAWLDSDCEDDFFRVNGDFTPSPEGFYQA